MQARRFTHNPIITPQTHPGVIEKDRANVNGPSLIRVPAWLPNPLGRYYLYFAHHHGRSIRLAYANDPAGPWTLHEGGTLRLDQTPFDHHIASPDVHIDESSRRVFMFYHGCCAPGSGFEQPTCVAWSDDGVTFTSGTAFLAESYLRAFGWDGGWIGVAKGGRLYWTDDIEQPWQTRWQPLDYSGRHWAGWIEGRRWHLVYSRWGDAPEHLLHGWVDLSEPRADWRLRDRVSLLRPEHEWEGAHLPVEVSRLGAAKQPVHELRDPAVFDDAGRRLLVYSIAGEMGLAIAELIDRPNTEA